jgi:hypothetical protein
MTADADAQPAEATEPGKGRRRLAIALIVIASLLAFLAIFAIWANRQLLNTDNWARTSSELLDKKSIRTQVAGFLVDQLYANVDVQSDLEQVFREVLTPERASVLAGPAAGGLRGLAEDATNRALQRPVPQRVWEEANRRAQLRLLEAIEGGGDVLSTSGGDVTLDLKALLGQTESNLGVGGRVEQRLPDSASQIVLLHSNQLALAQDVVWLLKTLAIVLVVLALALFALAVYLARGRRRDALRACGIGLLFAGAGALVAAALAGNVVVNALATTESVRPAAEDAWDVGTSLLGQAAGATIAYGVVIVIAAWLAGPTRWAVATRRQLAPYLREPRWAWGAFGVVVLALLAWAPTPAFRQAIPARADRPARFRARGPAPPDRPRVPRRSAERLLQGGARMGGRARRARARSGRALAGARRGPHPRTARAARPAARERDARRVRVRAAEGQTAGRRLLESLRLPLRCR